MFWMADVAKNYTSDGSSVCVSAASVSLDAHISKSSNRRAAFANGGNFKI